jgi:type VI secretion system protein ImpL
LASLDQMPPDLVTESNLLRLVSLPWFRAGFIPDELRYELIRQLDPELERHVRQAILGLLEKNPAPEGSLAQERQSLEIAVNRYRLSKSERQRRAIRRAIQRDHTAHGDYVVLRALRSYRDLPLGFLLPKGIRRFGFGEGFPTVGLPGPIALVTAAVVLIFGFLCGTSFVKNRALRVQVQDSMQELSREAHVYDRAKVGELQKLDKQRQLLVTLLEYNREGAPWSYRWGLYVGNDLYPDVRRLYFAHFKGLLFGQTQNRLAAFLSGLPATPSPGTPAYDQAYNTLKAYLITTSNHDRSSQEFLSPVLMKAWSANQTVDADRSALARKQFDFYAGELQVENPYSKQYDETAVRRSRAYLRQFGDLDRVYPAMKAGSPQASVNFNRQVSGSRPYVLGSYDVAGPFTKDGYKFMSDAIKNASRYLHGELWVLGEEGAINADPRELIKPLQARYQADYIKEWRNYLKNASVVKYKDLKDASEKLTMLSGNQSPLLALLALASNNIPWDNPDIAKALQAVGYVEPAGVERYSGPQNKDYIGALIKLQSSVDAVANSPAGTDSAAANQALSDARDARNVTNQLAAQNFNPDPEMLVQNLLLEPITNAEAKLRGLGPDQLNAAGQGLCGQFHAALSKYPFNLASKQDATVADMNGIFHNPDGALWQFCDANLKKFLTKQGSQYVPVAGGPVTLTPEFVAFFNQAAAFSDALYAGNTPDPHFTYKLTWLPSDGVQGVGLQIDGQSMDFSVSAAAKQFTWQGAGAHSQKATVRLGPGAGLGFSEHDGLWAMFRFFGEADTRHATTSGGESLEWVIRSGAGNKPITDPASGKPLVVRLELDMAGSPAIFQKNFFSRLACVAAVAK